MGGYFVKKNSEEGNPQSHNPIIQFFLSKLPLSQNSIQEPLTFCSLLYRIKYFQAVSLPFQIDQIMPLLPNSNTFTPIDLNFLMRLLLSLNIYNIEWETIPWAQRPELLKIIRLNTAIINEFRQYVPRTEQIYDDIIWLIYPPYFEEHDLAEKILKSNHISIKTTSTLIEHIQLEQDAEIFFYLLIMQNIIPRFLDLSKINFQDLKKYKRAILFSQCWLRHEDLEKLHDFVAQGGFLLTFGDIPHYNENLELDDTMKDLYLASIHKLVPLHQCVWTSDRIDFNLTTIIHLYSYHVGSRDNIKILAHEGSFTDVYAFKREYEKGSIIHSGISTSPNPKSYAYLLDILAETEFSIKNATSSQECLIFQNDYRHNERLIAITNLQSKPLLNIGLNLFNPESSKLALLELDNLTIPPKMMIFIHAFVEISPHIFIKYTNAELYGKNTTDPQLKHFFFRFNSPPLSERIKGVIIFTTQSLPDYPVNLRIIEGEPIITCMELPHAKDFKCESFGSFRLELTYRMFIFRFDVYPFSISGDT